MAESQDNSADGEKSEPEAVKAHDSKSIDRNLPMVVAPKLGAGEDEAIDEAPAEPAEAVFCPLATAVG